MEQLQKIYLDWVNNFITIEAFSNHYGVTKSDGLKLIEICKRVHESIVSEVF